jgi:hypothetical protein
MDAYKYTEPVAKLIKIGRPEHEWPNYLEQYSLTSAEIPELTRLVKDSELRWQEAPDDLSDDEELTEWYAQIHAWRALAQLKAEPAIPTLIGLLDQIDEYDDDWWGEESFEVFPLIGPVTIKPLADYLHNTSNPTWGRVAASSSLEKMAKVHPDFRATCVEAIVIALKNHSKNDESVNGSLIAGLVELNDVEHIDVIREAFESGNVDTDIEGDFEDVEIDLGLRTERSTPRKPTKIQMMMDEFLRRPERHLPSGEPGLEPYTKDEKKRFQEKEKKEKDKRKQEKKARKKHKNR